MTNIFIVILFILLFLFYRLMIRKPKKGNLNKKADRQPEIKRYPKAGSVRKKGIGSYRQGTHSWYSKSKSMNRFKK